VANELIRYGYYKWPWLGIELPGSVGSGLPGQAQTLTIAGIDRGGPSDGRLKVGDVLTTWDGQPIRNYDQLVGDVTSAVPGQVVTLGVLRAGKAITVRVKLGTEPRSEVLGQTQPQTTTQQPEPAEIPPANAFPFPFTIPGAPN